MRILLTNDDGIDAPGISALRAGLEGMGEILVVAPASVQSAKSHGITFHHPLLVRDAKLACGAGGLAVEGTPADCVKLALRALWSDRFGEGTRPDVVISGMNCGANVGINVIYSGTVAAAIEAAFLGVPAIAVSLHIGDRRRIAWARAATIARGVIDRLVQHPLDAHRVMNVNIPRTERDDAPAPEIRVVPMNTAAGRDGYERRVAPDGRTYYWPCGSGMEFMHTAEGSDVEALNMRHATVTPLFHDLTDPSTIEAWRARLER